MSKVARLIALLAAALASTPTPAQAVLTSRRAAPTFEIAVSGIGVRSLQVGSGRGFAQAGGSASVALRAFRNLSAVAKVDGMHTGSQGSSGVPLSLVATTFGARYRVLDRRHLSLFGQGLIGEANGFHGLFPSGTGLQSSSSSFAAQAGGGLDLSVRRHVAVRVLEASWLRTQLPNGSSNVENSLLLGAGVVFLIR